MDDAKKREQRTRQIIANAERLIAEVDETLARADRLLGPHQLDRVNLAEFIKNNPNAAKVMAEVQKGISDMAQDMERKNQQHAVDARLVAEPREPAMTDLAPKPRRLRTMI